MSMNIRSKHVSALATVVLLSVLLSGPTYAAESPSSPQSKPQPTMLEASEAFLRGPWMAGKVPPINFLYAYYYIDLGWRGEPNQLTEGKKKSPEFMKNVAYQAAQFSKSFTLETRYNIPGITILTDTLQIGKNRLLPGDLLVYYDDEPGDNAVIVVRDYDAEAWTASVDIVQNKKLFSNSKFSMSLDPADAPKRIPRPGIFVLRPNNVDYAKTFTKPIAPNSK